MTGLVGFTGDYDPSEAASLLKRMVQSLTHNSEHLYQVEQENRGNVGLGRATLNCLNPEQQPLWHHECPTIGILFYGELHDRETVLHQLNRKEDALVATDVALVLDLYMMKGDAFVNWLNGSFVVAIWDGRSNKMLLATDPMGTRNIYYTVHNNRLLFASGLRALLADPSLPKTIDFDAVAQFLTFEQVINDNTLLAAAKWLKPASILTWQEGKLDVYAYWKLPFNPIDSLRSEQDYLDGLSHYMHQAVTRQARKDLSQSVMLSGGLDSRLLLAILKNGLVEGELPTFGFGTPGCDDGRYAQELAQLAGSPFHFYPLNPGYLRELGALGVSITDGMESVVHMQALTPLPSASKLADVVYKGYLGGSLMGCCFSREMWGNYEPNILMNLFFNNFNILFSSTELQNTLFTDTAARQQKTTPYNAFQKSLSECESDLPVHQLDHFILRYQDPRFNLKGVELVRSKMLVRTPFCDKDLVEYALSIPVGLRMDKYLMQQLIINQYQPYAKIPNANSGYPLIPTMRDLKIRINQQSRWVLRRAGLKRIAPLQKREYADYDTWMRSTLLNWVEETLLSNQSLSRDYFQENSVRSLIAEHKNGSNHARKLGVLLALELWHQLFID